MVFAYMLLKVIFHKKKIIFPSLEKRLEFFIFFIFHYNISNGTHNEVSRVTRMIESCNIFKVEGDKDAELQTQDS